MKLKDCDKFREEIYIKIFFVDVHSLVPHPSLSPIICNHLKYEVNFRSTLLPLCADVINVWSLNINFSTETLLEVKWCAVTLEDIVSSLEDLYGTHTRWIRA